MIEDLADDHGIELKAIDLLEKVRNDPEEKFPEAREFLRPGFDELELVMLYKDELSEDIGLFMNSRRNHSAALSTNPPIWYSARSNLKFLNKKTFGTYLPCGISISLTTRRANVTA